MLVGYFRKKALIRQLLKLRKDDKDCDSGIDLDQECQQPISERDSVLDQSIGYRESVLRQPASDQNKSAAGVGGQNDAADKIMAARKNREYKRAAELFLDNFCEADLRTLLKIIESKGSDWGPCILPQKSKGINFNGQNYPGHVFCVKLWRWPTLPRAAENAVNPLVWCQNQGNITQCGSYNCCNPYHYALFLDADSKDESVKRNQKVFLWSNQKPSETPSSSAYVAGWGGSAAQRGLRDGWCHLFYWEQMCRVGPQFHVKTPTVSVSNNLPPLPSPLSPGPTVAKLPRCGKKEGDAASAFSANQQASFVDLAQLAPPTSRRPSCVQKVRQKIGSGFVIFRACSDPWRVWLYNRCYDCSLFVKATHLRLSEDSPAQKLPSGYCMLIHDFSQCPTVLNSSTDSSTAYNTSSLQCNVAPDAEHLPVVTYTSQTPPKAAISFAKGWGPHSKYSRKFITCCPCWIEVYFVNR